MSHNRIYIVKFATWIKMREMLLPLNDLGDLDSRPDLTKAGLGGDKDLPLDMRSSATTSAFPTYELPKKVKKVKRS